MNKFSELHCGLRVIFCKTDFLSQEFENIKNLKNDVVLITGNSDYPIVDNHIQAAPKNIKTWFAQNAISNSCILQPLPLGLENKLESIRSGHGIGYLERVSLKENLLQRNIKITPTKKIYANFNIETNYNYRSSVKSICIEANHIDWEEPNLTINQFFDKILDYEMVICPAGNGVDTHRLWEVLYSNRIPVTIKTGNYKIYELYENYPIIVLDCKEQLYDFDLINEKYKEIKNKIFNQNMLSTSFWKQKIIQAREEL